MMSDNFVQPLECLRQSGYTMLKGVFEPDEVAALADRLSVALQAGNAPSILRSRGQTYGSRNLLETFPQAITLLNNPALKSFAAAVLGRKAGIVRALYFDKPPDRSWSLPWHKDLTIAVKRNDLPSMQFRKPTVKAGVPHVEAPRSLLENMLTLRIHVDAMNGANGPLCVMPGSHRGDDSELQHQVALHAETGDVLAMRPLLSHSSIMSQPGTRTHRRVIHFELAQDAALPDGYEWHSFVPIDSNPIDSNPIDSNPR